MEDEKKETLDSTPAGAADNNTAESSSSEKGGIDVGDEDGYPHGLHLIAVTMACLVSVFLISLDQTIVGTAIPKITDEFGGISDITWYAAAYFMTNGGMQTSAGKLYAFVSLKWAFIGSMVVFEVGSLICGVAHNANTLIVGRAIAGLGGAGLSVGGNCIVSLSVAPKKRGMLQGLIGMTYCVGAVLGPILGGAFTSRVSWRWCFFINLPIGIASAIVLLFFQLPGSDKDVNLSWFKILLHLDPVGIALVMGSITCFVLAVQYGGNTHPWNSSVVIGLLVGFGLIIAATVVWEIWLGDYSMMQPKLYKRRATWVSAAYQFFFFGSYVTLLYYLPIYFQSIKNASPIRSGVDNLPLVLSAAVFAVVGGVIATATGRPQIVMIVSSSLATVAIGLIYTWDIDTPQARWVGYQFFLGCVMAAGIMHGVVIAQAYAEKDEIEFVTANILFWQVLGGAFGSASGQSAFLNRMSHALVKNAPGVAPSKVIATGASAIHQVFASNHLAGVIESYMTGIQTAFLVALAFSGVAVVFAFGLPYEKLPTHTDDKATEAA